MPIYPFKCERCEKEIEALIMGSEDAGNCQCGGRYIRGFGIPAPYLIPSWDKPQNLEGRHHHREWAAKEKAKGPLKSYGSG